MSLLNYETIGTVKKEKRKNKVNVTVVWVGGCDPVDVTIVYCSNSYFFCVFTEG